MFDNSLADSPTPSEESTNSKPRDLTASGTATAAAAATKSSSSAEPSPCASAGPTAAMFGAATPFDPTHFDPLRLLMNRSLNPAVLNPLMAQPAALLSLQISRQMSATLMHSSLTPDPESAISLQQQYQPHQLQHSQKTETVNGGPRSDSRRASNLEASSTAAAMPKRSKLLIDEILNLKTSEVVSQKREMKQEDCSSESRDHSAERTILTKNEEKTVNNDSKNCGNDAISVSTTTSSYLTSTTE